MQPYLTLGRLARGLFAALLSLASDEPRCGSVLSPEVRESKELDSAEVQPSNMSPVLCDIADFVG